MKYEDESFTEIVLRLTGAEENIIKGYGAWEDTNPGGAAEETREELDGGFEKRQDELFGH